MSLKKRQLALAVGLVAGLSAAGQSAAAVYGRSYLALDHFHVNIYDGNGVETFTAATDFGFTITNTASLNGNAAASPAANCGGKPFNIGTNTCSTTTPRLDGAVANAPGGTVTRVDEAYNFIGPGGGQYSTADSAILTAEIANSADYGPSVGSSTKQITESELVTGTQASSSTLIQSDTSLKFTFNLTQGSSMALSFNAVLDMMAELSADPLRISGSSQNDVSVIFTLTQTKDAAGNDGTGNAVWAPNGTTGAFPSGGCQSLDGGVGCTVTLDPYSLNQSANRNNANGTTTRSLAFDPLNPNANKYAGLFTGLSDGIWTLTLAEKTSTTVRQTVIPAPGVLALMGLGLAGLGVSRRSSKQA